MSTFTEEDVRSVLRVAHPRHRVTFLLAAYAGLRAGEIRWLRWLFRRFGPANDKFVALNAYGRAWTDGGLLQAFQRAYQRAGLKGWRFHDLRHFFVTALFEKGSRPPTVQALAGHAHLTTTERYAHVARTDLKAAIARLAG